MRPVVLLDAVTSLDEIRGRLEVLSTFGNRIVFFGACGQTWLSSDKISAWRRLRAWSSVMSSS